MSDAIERFLQWKRELNQKLWPLPLLSPLYDAGLVIGLFKPPPLNPSNTYPQPNLPYPQYSPATGGVATSAVAGYALGHGGIHPLGRWSNYLGHPAYPGQFYGSYGQPYFYPQYTYQPPDSYWRPYVPMFGY
jgi:hypothetical protein